MTRENALLDIPIPPVPLGRRAGQLAFLLGLEGPFASDMVPPLPVCLKERVTAPQQARYDQDAVFALDIAAFAVKMSQPEHAERLRAFRPAKNWRHPAAMLKNPSSRNPDKEQKVQAAILGYSKALSHEARWHRRDPELAPVREYRRFCQKQSGNNLSLKRSYHTGIGALSAGAQVLNRSYFQFNFNQSAPDVLRNSLPVLRFTATLPIAVVDGSQMERLVPGANKDGECLAMPDKKISKHVLKSEVDPIFIGRTNNRCPALAPVKAVSEIGALELLYLQQIDALEAAGTWE